MKFHELKVVKNKAKRRDGRGIAAGRGKTAGRGTKGQKSRSGSSRKPGFEGGQNPLMQRLPKLRGFTSHRAEVNNVNTGQLSAFTGKVDNFTLFEAGLVESPYTKVKVIVKGDLTTKIDIKLQGISENALAAVQTKGGTFTKTAQVKRTKQEKEDKETK
jgi:large subunit ribosomal protein L15